MTEYGGVIGERRGCEIVAYFGVPHTKENDGERAVRAALAIQRALVNRDARNPATGAPEFAARIGLDSGRVIVDSAGEVYGEALNVAARVQSAATPGDVWITLGVHRQIAGQFVAEDKGEHELKGVPDKLQLYRIVRVSGAGGAANTARDGAGRPRRGARYPRAPLGARAPRRWSAQADRRRARPWQVAADRGVPRPAR